MDLDKISASQLIENDYMTYGSYVNTTRAITGLDGLKTVQRRMLLALRDVASNGWSSSAAVVGRCIVYHPHSEQYDTLVKLVNNGFAVGKGGFGGRGLEDIDPSPMRYTKVKAHKKFNETIFKLEPYVPHFIDHDLEEPVYLPVPVPLGLTTGSSGIGVGLRNEIPIFDIKSLLNAKKKDDPTLLRGPEGTLIIAGDFERLWEQGIGWLQYGLKCYKQWSSIDGKDVSVIEGSLQAFVPKVLKQFGKFVEDGAVYYRDETSSQFKVVISRVKGIRRFTDEDIHKRCQKIAKKTFYYKMYVSQDGAAKRIGLRSWLDQMWSAFETAVDNYKNDKTEQIDHKIYIYNLIPKVVPYLQKSTDTETIAKNLKVDKKDVAEVESKSLRLQRNVDLEEIIDDLKIEKDRVSKINADSMCKTFLEALKSKDS